MSDERLLEAELDQQFELRTGLNHRDKFKYWNTAEGQTGEWESTAGRQIPRRIGALAMVALVVLIASPLIIAKLTSSSDQLASVDTTEDPIVIAARADVARNLQARKTVESFLAANSVEEMAKYVCDRQRVLPLMTDYYRDHPIPQVIGLPAIKILATTMKFPTIHSYWYAGTKESAIQYGDLYDGPGFTLRDCGDHFEIEWESLVGYNAMTLTEYMEARPTGSVEFRLIAKPSDYYNYEFTDESAFQAFELSLIDDSDYLIGYAEKDGDPDGIAARLEKLTADAETGAPVILAVELSDRGQHQVRIAAIVQEHWIVEEHWSFGE